MKLYCIYRLPGRFMLVAACLIFLYGTAAAEQGYIERIAKSLEGSTLSKAEQAEVRVQADAAVKAGVSAEDVELIVRRAIERDADADAVIRLLHIPLSLNRQGLPTGPVLDRIEQGLAKRISPAKIALASERLAEKMAAGRPVVDGLVQKGIITKESEDRDMALTSTARALEHGLPVETLTTLGALVHERHGSLRYFASAVDAAAYFAGSGMSAQTAAGFVQHAVERGYTERDLDAMIRQIDVEMKHGTRAEDAAARMDRETMQGGQSGQGSGRQGMMSGGSGAGTGSGRNPGSGGPRR